MTPEYQQCSLCQLDTGLLLSPDTGLFVEPRDVIVLANFKLDVAPGVFDVGPCMSTACARH